MPWNQITGTTGGGSGAGFFEATVDPLNQDGITIFSTVADAFTAGFDRILVVADCTETASITLDRDLHLRILPDALADFGNFPILSDGATEVRLQIESTGGIDFSSGSNVSVTRTLRPNIRWATAGSVCIDGVGDNIDCFIQNCIVENAATATGAYLTSSSVQLVMRNVRYIVPNQSNCGINTYADLSNVSIAGGGTLADNILVVDRGKIVNVLLDSIVTKTDPTTATIVNITASSISKLSVVTNSTSNVYQVILDSNITVEGVSLSDLGTAAPELVLSGDSRLLMNLDNVEGETQITGSRNSLVNVNSLSMDIQAGASHNVHTGGFIGNVAGGGGNANVLTIAATADNNVFVGTKIDSLSTISDSGTNTQFVGVDEF